MLAIQIIRAKGLPRKDEYFTTVNFCGEEIFRTDGCHRESNGDPVWQDADEFSLDEFNGKEEENKRPLFLEKISIQVYAERGERKSELVGEARVPLFNIGPPQWYKLVPKVEGVFWDAQILTTLSFPQSKLQEFSNISFLPFSEVLDISNIQYSPLFLNFGDSALSLFGANPLPGPTCGETLLDYHGFVEIEMSTGVNLFKDKCSVQCEGSLYLTDLRVVFIPNSLTPSPPGFLSIPHVADGESCASEANLLAIRRMTLQLPISGIQDIKCQSSSKDSNIASLRIVSRNSMTTEFIIKGNQGVGKDKDSLPPPPLPSPSPSLSLSQLEQKLGKQFYTGGLMSRDMPPLLWCTRMTEELRWLLREDLCWVRWAEYLGLTMCSLFPAALPNRKSISAAQGFVFREFAAGAHGQPPTEESVTSRKNGRRSSLKETTTKAKEDLLLKKFDPCVERFITVPDPFRDYTRMGLHADVAWKISDLNEEHTLCATYPDVLVFPATLSDEEVKEASGTRSKERLPALVWVHPTTRTPLCRCAQPLAGISGVYVTEADVKMCLAIRAASLNDPKQLRILDCRPKINAHANAIQGKGFENVASLGGAEGATLVFADIHNIHVMREALQKIRDTNGNNDSDEGQGGGNSSAISKWLNHVAAVLRGAAATAESLLLEYPVLVHCSDGWDRTAQISALSQLLLDPYYRTIDGFLMLVEKEWIGFGYQFEERLGRMTDKNTSPVFTQYLDCVWQLLNQYPTNFEFSSGFLEVLMMCAYSGLFSSFRHNCERQREEELFRHQESTLNTSISIVHFSSVFTYVHILLASSMGALLVNPKFQPSETEGAVSYLHPRVGVEDLTLWTQGLLPRGFSSFSQGGGRTVLSRVECDALASRSHTNLLHQWVSVLKYVPLGVNNSFDVMNGQHHGSFLSVQTPHENEIIAVQKVTNKQSSDISCYRQIDDDNRYMCAVIRVQVWRRVNTAMRRALIDNKQINASSACVRKLIMQLMILFYHTRLKESISSYVMQKTIIASIIHDVIGSVVMTCDEMSRVCPELIDYEAGTTRGTLHATSSVLETDSDFDSDDELTATTKSRSKSKSSDSTSGQAAQKGGKNGGGMKAGMTGMTSNLFSKISNPFKKELKYI